MPLHLGKIPSLLCRLLGARGEACFMFVLGVGG